MNHALLFSILVTSFTKIHPSIILATSSIFPSGHFPRGCPQKFVCISCLFHMSYTSSSAPPPWLHDPDIVMKSGSMEWGLVASLLKAHTFVLGSPQCGQMYCVLSAGHPTLNTGWSVLMLPIKNCVFMFFFIFENDSNKSKLWTMILPIVLYGLSP